MRFLLSLQSRLTKIESLPRKTVLNAFLSGLGTDKIDFFYNTLDELALPFVQPRNTLKASGRIVFSRLSHIHCVRHVIFTYGLEKSV